MFSRMMQNWEVPNKQEASAFLPVSDIHTSYLQMLESILNSCCWKIDCVVRSEYAPLEQMDGKVGEFLTSRMLPHFFQLLTLKPAKGSHVLKCVDSIWALPE